MPTGYTFGIIDGTIKDFKSFAEKCTRAFLVHMRDESFDCEYKKREPSKYYLEKIEFNKKKLEEYKKLSIVEIFNKSEKDLQEDLIKIENEIIKREKLHFKFLSFIGEAERYEAPTKDHERIKNFMIEQLTSTMNQDCNYSYYLKEKNKLKDKIENINPEKIKQQSIKDLENNINLYEEEYNKELKRCNESNEWYDKFIESIKI